MESKVRKRGQNQPYVDVEDQDTNFSKEKKPLSHDKFHWDLWLLLAVENWLFDFGRPIFALFVPQKWFPMNYPSVGDYCHMAYNVITPFCLLKLFERSPNKSSTTFNMLCIITFVMGASIHLVGDSINHRLVLLGYELHLSVRENPMMQQMQPQGLVDSFELLYLYDEVIGHLMWYIPFFISFFLYFVGCFTSKLTTPSSTVSWWLLMLVSGLYYWYLVTEGQIFSVYIITFICMLAMVIIKKSKGQKMDVNGRFLFYSFTTTFVLVGVWVLWLWNDPILRHKYPGLLYIPEPWSYYTLYLKPH
ncbi:CLN6 [Mytilus edulis]|uniref:CLN6 n=1 Tax=Mytilus edulis TaxID=6550 RepID=A0A8S3QX19_MYTED|nr:CLN6 [Mytilus edulis]